MTRPNTQLLDRFADHVGAGIRTRTTVRETAAEYARYVQLSTTGPLALKDGSLLATYAAMAQADPPPLSDDLSDDVTDAYRAAYSVEPPYNWTGAIADPRDITSTPAGP